MKKNVSIKIIVIRLLGFLLIFSVGTGCATYSDRTQSMRKKVTSGNYKAGLSEVNSLLEVKKPDELPEPLKPDDPLYLLERGSVLMALEDFESSSVNFKTADESLELLDISNDTAGAIGKYIYSDSATKYKATPIEKLALNETNMMNYLARGDLKGAQVEARRFTVMKDYLKQREPAGIYGTTGSYLAGFVFEKTGNADQALRHYDDALAKKGLKTLRKPILRLTKQGNYRGNHITGFLNKIPESDRKAMAADKGTGEVLIIANVGRVPHKIAKRVPIGAVIGTYGTFITGDPDILTHSIFKTVVYPELSEPVIYYNDGTIVIDGKRVKGELVSNHSADIKKEYEKAKPKIMGAAVSRLISRAVAAEATRKAAGGQSNIIGTLGALAVEGTMVATDKPDTRSWTLMPGYVYMVRERVPAGAHKVDIGLTGKKSLQKTLDVDVPDGGFAVVVLTTLR